jgi:phosphoribosyl 1,2-cyclic phosphodiesterase
LDFFTLASSSAGNSYFYGDESGGLLIDCGISCKNVVSALKSRDIAPESLSGVLITHEHSDHIKGLAVFLSHYNIPLFASAPVLEYLARNGCVPIGAELNEIDGSGELIGGMMVSPFNTSHDSVGSLGFSVSTPDGNKISVCTDTGYITDDAKEHIPGSRLVLIESNYDKGMLEAGRYPYSLKRRIAGSFGHLSNIDCAQYLPELIRTGTTHIILGHLSKENNIPEVAVETSVSNLSLCGMKRDKDYVLFSAPRSELSEKISF